MVLHYTTTSASRHARTNTMRKGKVASCPAPPATRNAHKTPQFASRNALNATWNHCLMKKAAPLAIIPAYMRQASASVTQETTTKVKSAIVAHQAATSAFLNNHA